MSSGPASYSVSATVYGREPGDSYYSPNSDQAVDDNLLVLGNLQVNGTSTLGGAVTCGSTLAVAGQSTLAGVTAGTVGVGGNLTVAGASTVAALTAGAVSASSVTSSGNVTGSAVTAVGNVSAATASVAGAVSAGSIVATGDISGATLHVSGPATLAAVTAGILSGAFAGTAAPYNPDGSTGITAISSIVIGPWRICWGYTTSWNQSSLTLRFSAIPAGSLPQQANAGCFNPTTVANQSQCLFGTIIGLNGLLNGSCGCFTNPANPNVGVAGNVYFQQTSTNTGLGNMFFVIGPTNG